MVASDGFAEFLQEQLAPLGHVTVRRMFGKSGVFCDGLMLAMVTDNTLYFRVDDDNRATFKEAAALPPLNYSKQGRSIDLSFWRAPERLFDDPEELVEWARSAQAAARRVAAKRPGGGPRSTGEPVAGQVEEQRGREGEGVQAVEDAAARRRRRRRRPTPAKSGWG